MYLIPFRYLLNNDFLDLGSNTLLGSKIDRSVALCKLAYISINDC